MDLASSGETLKGTGFSWRDSKHEVDTLSGRFSTNDVGDGTGHLARTRQPSLGGESNPWPTVSKK